jgi:Flp pilus assembly protein TadG
MKIFPKSERGQSLVEFALTITFVVMLLAGLVDLGNAFFSFVALRDAAQDGAVYAALYPIQDTNSNARYDSGEPLNTSEIVSRVRNASSSPIDLTDATKVTVNVSFSGDPCQGNTVTVSVTYNYPISVPFLGAILGSNTIPITASVTNTILAPACP